MSSNTGTTSEKFVGGAELARRNAQKRQNHGEATDKPLPCKKTKTGEENQRSKAARLPKKMTATNRFFASLFLSSVTDLMQSNTNETVRKRLVGDMCQRTGLPLPSPLPASSVNARDFYFSRASLVLEEARSILSDTLTNLDRFRSKQIRQWCMQLLSVNDQNLRKQGYIILRFEGHSRHSGISSPEDKRELRPCSCFIISPFVDEKSETSSNTKSLETSFLGAMLPTGRDRNERTSNVLELMAFDPSLSSMSPTTMWNVRPLTTLISTVRQFQACTRIPMVSFMPEIMGWKGSSHTRFEDDKEGNLKEKHEEEKIVGFVDKDVAGDTQKYFSSEFNLPLLNPTQERAAQAFLTSRPPSLTLVQGPPGTGKTTFLVSVLCRSLLGSHLEKMESRSLDSEYIPRRILVTAPTNKAILVLASRFLDAIGENENFNIALIGVEEKLFSNDCEAMTDSLDDVDMPPQVKDIFVYTWAELMAKKFQSLERGLYPAALDKDHSCTLGQILQKARSLKNKVLKRIPSLSKVAGLEFSVNKFISFVENASKSMDDRSPDSFAEASFNLGEARKILGILVSNLKSFDSGIVVSNLLATADVIFCTLSTAGTAAMKSTRRVDDLFVDEAASATEPEICIPFQLLPSRMLAVGDPKQLPATIMSRHAEAMGLNKSLHERLMSDCKKESIMLDVQYRMNPEISSFPSKQFYGSKLLDGENVLSVERRNQSTIVCNAPYQFYHVDGREQTSYSGSYCNSAEAEAIVEICKNIRASRIASGNNLYSVECHDSKISRPWDCSDCIRIITFYQGQVTEIRRLLRQNGLGQLLVSTVDSSQGCEADVVIVSFVRSNEKSGDSLRRAGFLNDDRRVNVALTRARHNLVCVGDAYGTLAHSGAETLRALISDAEARQNIIKKGREAIKTAQCTAKTAQDDSIRTIHP